MFAAIRLRGGGRLQGYKCVQLIPERERETNVPDINQLRTVGKLWADRDGRGKTTTTTTTATATAVTNQMIATTTTARIKREDATGISVIGCCRGCRKRIACQNGLQGYRRADESRESRVQRSERRGTVLCCPVSSGRKPLPLKTIVRTVRPSHRNSTLSG